MDWLLLPVLLLNIASYIPVFVCAGQLCTTHLNETGTCSSTESCNALGYSKTSPSCNSSEICCVRISVESDVNQRRNLKDNLLISTLRRKKRQSLASSSEILHPADVPYLRIKGCGIREISMTDFVIGGENADYWPWMAAIFVRPEGAKTPSFRCGGTVISKTYILTAAHCLKERNVVTLASELSVRVGGLNPMGDGHDYAVAKVIVHQDYRSNIRYNDIGLLRLSEDIKSKMVVPACLPSQGMYNSNFYRRNATVLGWGRLSVGGFMSRSLQEAIVPIVPTKKCNSRYSRLNSLSLPRGIIDTQLCAGIDDGGRDACQGDSGGPLQLEDKSYKWNVVGIVSFGYSCAVPGYPGVYTRVARYLPWLANNTDLDGRNPS